MITRLPRWAWWGGAALTFLAGMINAVGFVGFQHRGVTHLTGNATLLGMAVAEGDLSGAWGLLALIGAFVAGCVCSGFLIRDSAFQLGRRYGVALLLESALLFAATLLLRHENPAGYLLAAGAGGLQNGMVSTYSGAVLRTTHVTGLFTDLGVALGRMLRGKNAVDERRVRLYGLLLGSFCGGSVAGVAGFLRFGYDTLYTPAVLTGGLGLNYELYRLRWTGSD